VLYSITETFSVDKPASGVSATSHALEVQLNEAWEMAASPTAMTPETTGQLQFVPVSIPGTVAGALHEQGAWRAGDRANLDNSEYWFRCRFNSSAAAPGEQIVLRIGGIATIAEVWLNGEHIVHSNSMFAVHEPDITHLVRDRNELLIVCRSLNAALRSYRGRTPLERWRTRIVTLHQLRWVRTTLLGRCPGFAAGPEPVGPWRPITLVRRRQIVVEEVFRQVSRDGTTGVIDIGLRVRVLRSGAEPLSGELQTTNWTASFDWERSGSEYHGRAVLRISNAALWWPHTHGTPALYPLRIKIELTNGSTIAFDRIPAGFRSLKACFEPEDEPVSAFRINGTPVFCRGVVWTPPDIVSLHTDRDTILRRLKLLRDGGFNLIRIAGTTIYEDETFHRLCDELGMLVWQDMMFANLDYPFENGDFERTVRKEAEAELSRIGRHPSLALICGNSEIEQQVAMLGLDPALGRGKFFGEELPRLAAKYCPSVPYIPSAPYGGDMPFRTNRGAANYFGVGAYMRPIEDARRAEVRFASECLAFANVPEPDTVDEIARSIPGGLSLTHPEWKRRVPRDSGTHWDFEDVRDFYLRLLYAVDPVALRYADVSRYLDLSRMTSGGVMSEVFGEWRRPSSPSAGGIILWGADLDAGAGWGVLDNKGLPKSPYWFLKRVLAPRAIWTTDEGLNGIDIHIANDRSDPLDAILRVALYRFEGRTIASADCPIKIRGRSAKTFGVEEILGRFVDASYSFHFGPPGHDLVVAGLHTDDSGFPIARCFRFPHQHPPSRSSISELGLAGEAALLNDGRLELLLQSRRFAWGVRVASLGWMADDNYFGIEPGGKHRITLTPSNCNKIPENIVLTATNADGRILVPIMRSA
jgi:beta-mannosidase